MTAPVGLLDHHAEMDSELLLPAGLASEEQRWSIAIEVARIGWKMHGTNVGDEAWTRRLAAAILMPRESFEVMSRSLSVDDIASAFSVRPQTAALRLGELAIRPVAVVAGTRSWIRGRDYAWPESPLGMYGLSKRPTPDLERVEIQHVHETRTLLMGPKRAA